MNQNKTSKYFKYAIGEIVLVVIGILIALQINNWNEHQKALKQERLLYTKILANLNDELILFQKVLNEYKEHDDVHYNLYNAIIGKDSLDPNLPYGMLRWNMSFSPTFKDNYQNKIDVITNDNIRTAILNYFRIQDKTDQVIDLFETSKANLLRPYVTNNDMMNLDLVFDENRVIGSRYFIKYDAILKQLKDPRFIHIITDLRIKTEAGARNIAYLKDANLTLQGIIKAELND